MCQCVSACEHVCKTHTARTLPRRCKNSGKTSQKITQTSPYTWWIAYGWQRLFDPESQQDISQLHRAKLHIHVYTKHFVNTRQAEKKRPRTMMSVLYSSGTQAVMPCNTQTQRWKSWINEAGKKRCIICQRCLQRCMICKKWLQTKMLRDARVNWNWNSSPISKQYNPTSATDQCLKHYVTVYQCPLNSFDY